MDAHTASGRYAYGGIDNGSSNPVREFALRCVVAEQDQLDCDASRPGISIKVYIKARADGLAMIRYTGNNGRSFTGGLMSRV